jgi:hypothetical protein
MSDSEEENELLIHFKSKLNRKFNSVQDFNDIISRGYALDAEEFIERAYQCMIRYKRDEQELENSRKRLENHQNVKKRKRKEERKRKIKSLFKLFFFGSLAIFLIFSVVYLSIYTAIQDSTKNIRSMVKRLYKLN